MDPYEEMLSLVPSEMVRAMEGYRSFDPEELRMRMGRPPSIVYGGKEHRLSLPPVREEDLQKVLQKATGASLYSASQAIKQGYFCHGALRIGVCGQAVSDGKGTGFTHYSSLCVRMARECRDICPEITEKLKAQPFSNTLILSPPGGGKTTALRDIVRILSDSGRRIGIIDERGELSGHIYDLGECSDVISGIDKLKGALLLLRSMTPQIIAADEITAPGDVLAVEEIFGCGTGVLATAHAADPDDLRKRDSYRRLLDKGVFQKAVLIRMRDGKRSYELRDLSC